MARRSYAPTNARSVTDAHRKWAIDVRIAVASWSRVRAGVRLKRLQQFPLRRTSGVARIFA